MDDLLRLACELAATAPGRVLVVGGLAVRVHLGTLARRTDDVDLVTLDMDARTAVGIALRARGYALGESAGWLRGVPTSSRDPIVDVATDPVVSPSTLDRHRLCAPPRVVVTRAGPVAAVGAVDLAILKLLAHRPQDLVDLALLSSATSVPADAVAASAEADDAERAVASGAVAARLALADGTFDDAAHELLGRTLTIDERGSFQRWLATLEREGL